MAQMSTCMLASFSSLIKTSLLTCTKNTEMSGRISWSDSANKRSKKLQLHTTLLNSSPKESKSRIKWSRIFKVVWTLISLEQSRSAISV
jgi:hypothetical protein